VRSKVAVAVVHVQHRGFARCFRDEEVFVAVEIEVARAMPMLPSGLPVGLSVSEPEMSPSSTNVPS